MCVRYVVDVGCVMYELWERDKSWVRDRMGVVATG